MAFVGGPAWALINCLLAQAVAVTAADRSEVRTRVQSSELAYDADTRPSLRLQLTTPTTGYSFGYAPTFTALAIGTEDSQIIISHSLDASVAARWERTTFSLSENVTYGTYNFRAQSIANQPAAAPPASTTPPTGTTPPGTTTPGTTTPPATMPPAGQSPTPNAAAQQVRVIDQTIRIASSTTTAQLQHAFSPVTVGRLGGGYEYAGGLDAESRGFLPIRRGPNATIGVMYRAARADDLTTAANGIYLETGSTTRAAIIDVHEEWTHRWLPALSTSLAAGVAVARAENNGFPRRLTNAIVPVSTASLDYRFGYAGGRVRTLASLQFLPVIDRFTGDYDQRVQWMLDVNWTRYHLSLITNFSGAVSVLPDVVFTGAATVPFNYYFGSVGALYRFGTELSIEGGLRATWVRIRAVDTDPLPLLWSLYAAVTYTLGPAHL